MNKNEYLEKCMSVANVLAKIINGVEVSREERLKAFLDAVEVLNYEKSLKQLSFGKVPLTIKEQVV